VVQHPIPPPFSPLSLYAPPVPASLAYSSNGDTNPEPFLLSPILNLPASFGSAYVGETFSCTLCANHDAPEPAGFPGAAAPKRKNVRDVRIDAEMKTPGAGAVQKLELVGPSGSEPESIARGVDLEADETLQRVVNFDLKEEGNHVLAVTVSYYEATETSGRTRTFRKLYQFICKASLIVRTKIGPFPAELVPARKRGRRRWVLEAQLENCSEEAMQLERILLELEEGLVYTDCNWEGAGGSGTASVSASAKRPILQPSEVEQACFIVEEGYDEGEDATTKVKLEGDGRLILGVLGIGWRGEMGNRGFLSTGKLGTRYHSGK
jgi:hypothetical protein